jgi:hypothetical protein
MMNKRQPATVKAGQPLLIPYQSRELTAVVINPNGVRTGKPTIGFTLPILEELLEIPKLSLSSWEIETKEGFALRLPSGKTFPVCKLQDGKEKTISSVEASDCKAIAADLVKHPEKGKAKKTVIDFLVWFEVDGFYGRAYCSIERVYTDTDSLILQKWKEERERGKPSRKNYSHYIHSQDRKHGKWTNVVYQGLFGCNAAKMKEIWATQAGSPQIARNHIPELIGLQAVAHCERLIVLLGLDSVQEAHTEAIRLTQKKFGFDQQNLAA